MGENQEEMQNALAVFQEALTAPPTVYTWHYDTDGTILDTNCPEHVYHRIFEHTGCLAYMLRDRENRGLPLILGAPLGVMWCAVYERENDEMKSCYVIGPVSDNAVSNELIDEAVMRYHIDPLWQPSFIKMMRDIPVVSSIIFFQYAVLLHFFVTGEKISRSELRFQQQEVPAEKKKRTAGRSRHHIYQAEQTLLQMIRDGNLNYRGAMAKAGQLSGGLSISTGDPVQRAILSAANFTALCTRAAIEGGLTPDTAYTVGDNYIQSLTGCRTIADVRTVNHAMFEDFIERVHRQRMNPEYSQQVQSCAAYIETHLDEELTLSQLAAEVGYSEYHLSRKFKKETGKNLREYIRDARIERAKLLLSSSELSIKEIAEQLQFCAPSHFAAVFREVTGQLPQQYRKENYK